MSLLPQHHAHEVQPAQSSEEGTRLRGQDLNGTPEIIASSIFLRLCVKIRSTNRSRLCSIDIIEHSEKCVNGKKKKKKKLEDENSELKIMILFEEKVLCIAATRRFYDDTN